MNDNTINFDEFINKIKSFKSIDARNNYIKSVIHPEEYVPFEVVCVLCDQILAASYYDKDGNFRIDSCKKYLNYMYIIYTHYLNIDMNSTKFIEQYNEIQRLGINDTLVGLVPESQIGTLDAVLKMKSDDIIANNYEMHAFIKNELAKFYPAIAGAMTDFLKTVDSAFANVDVNKIVEFVKPDDIK